MKKFFERINKSLETLQNSVSKPKHIVGLILAVASALLTAYFKETIETIHDKLHFILYLFSFLWVQFHLAGLKIFHGPLN